MPLEGTWRRQVRELPLSSNWDLRQWKMDAKLLWNNRLDGKSILQVVHYPLPLTAAALPYLQWSPAATPVTSSRVSVTSRTPSFAAVHTVTTRVLLASVQFYFASWRDAKYCDLRVCLSVCLCVCPLAYLRNHTSELRDFSVHVTCGRGSVLFWWQCNTSRTSGFVDDVTFSHNWPKTLEFAT